MSERSANSLIEPEWSHSENTHTTSDTRFQNKISKSETRVYIIAFVGYNEEIRNIPQSQSLLITYDSTSFTTAGKIAKLQSPSDIDSLRQSDRIVFL